AASSSANAVSVSVYATGFNDPRGLKFGPDGHLYVAEGGLGGHNSTVGQCTQVPSTGPGPVTGSPTSGRISKVVNGQRVTITDQFPSDTTNAKSGNAISGVADIAFIGDTLYAITAGGGCSHGVANTSNGVFRVSADGHITEVANLSAFIMANPTAHEEDEDFEPDGTWYSMISLRGALYAVEPNHGELDRITPNGSISRVADISASQGHIVPTALAYHGNFYIGNLYTFPIPGGASKIMKVTPSGYVSTVATGLDTVVGLAFDNRDRMYALELTAGKPGPTPGFGDIVRIDPNGKKTIILSGLHLPTALTMGPDGALYVSDWGVGPPGLGRILKVTGL
ncbi:MAG TPA: ScyD/ScyE family protein, partial [Sphingomicrobium sp.]|nr:ScyD/ScyE family protein [Sphingomicrobium sp.]